MRPLVACLLIVAHGGCATVPMATRTGSPKPLPESIRRLYAYAPEPLTAVYESEQKRSGYSFQQILLQPPGGSKIKPIRIDWYLPDKPGRHPVILLSPILAGNDLYVREFAKFYAPRSLHAVIVYRPREIFSPERDLSDIEVHFRESVEGLRRTIDWLQPQETVDATQIGSFGVSLGAMVTTILAAVEPRVKAHVFGLPAGDVAHIIMTSKDKTIRKRRRAYLEKRGWSEEEGLQALEAAIQSEPMRLAPYLNPGRCLTIGGIFDRVLGFHRTLDFWQAAGRPQLILLPTGHYTAVLATPYLKIATYSFLTRKLKD